MLLLVDAVELFYHILYTTSIDVVIKIEPPHRTRALVQLPITPLNLLDDELKHRFALFPGMVAYFHPDSHYFVKSQALVKIRLRILLAMLQYEPLLLQQLIALVLDLELLHLFFNPFLGIGFIYELQQILDKHIHIILFWNNQIDELSPGLEAD